MRALTLAGPSLWSGRPELAIGKSTVYLIVSGIGTVLCAATALATIIVEAGAGDEAGPRYHRKGGIRGRRAQAQAGWRRTVVLGGPQFVKSLEETIAA